MERELRAYTATAELTPWGWRIIGVGSSDKKEHDYHKTFLPEQRRETARVCFLHPDVGFADLKNELTPVIKQQFKDDLNIDVFLPREIAQRRTN